MARMMNVGSGEAVEMKFGDELITTLHQKGRVYNSRAEFEDAENIANLVFRDITPFQGKCGELTIIGYIVRLPNEKFVLEQCDAWALQSLCHRNPRSFVLINDFNGTGLSKTLEETLRLNFPRNTDPYVWYLNFNASSKRVRPRANDKNQKNKKSKNQSIEDGSSVIAEAGPDAGNNNNNISEVGPNAGNDDATFIDLSTAPPPSMPSPVQAPNATNDKNPDVNNNGMISVLAAAMPLPQIAHRSDNFDWLMSVIDEREFFVKTLQKTEFEQWRTNAKSVWLSVADLAGENATTHFLQDATETGEFWQNHPWCKLDNWEKGVVNDYVIPFFQLYSRIVYFRDERTHSEKRAFLRQFRPIRTDPRYPILVQRFYQTVRAMFYTGNLFEFETKVVADWHVMDSMQIYFLARCFFLWKYACGAYDRPEKKRDVDDVLRSMTIKRIEDVNLKK